MKEEEEEENEEEKEEPSAATMLVMAAARRSSIRRLAMVCTTDGVRSMQPTWRAPRCRRCSRSAPTRPLMAWREPSRSTSSTNLTVSGGLGVDGGAGLCLWRVKIRLKVGLGGEHVDYRRRRPLLGRGFLWRRNAIGDRGLLKTDGQGAVALLWVGVVVAVVVVVLSRRGRG